MKKRFSFISLTLVIVLLLGVVPVGAQSVGTPLAYLNEIETILYGKAQPGAVITRVESIEREIYGSPREGAIMARIDQASEFLDGSQNATSLKLQLNLVEWGFLAKLTSGSPLLVRLENIETEFFGIPQTGSLKDRIEQMMMFVWGTTSLDMKPVTVPKETLLEVELLTTVDSGKNKVGDKVPYRVSRDLVIDGRVVVPRGAEGIGEITEVVSKGSLGRNGRVVIDFRNVPAFDGKEIRILISEKATEQNMSLELAAGASMAGVVLLGPVGLVGGYFVKGQDVQIASGAKFFVETVSNTQTLGFKLMPAQ